MKFLIHSNAPHVKTGYGVQTKYLAEHLHDAGHDVAVSCTYGLSGEVMPWSARRITLYPTGYEMNGLDVIHSHALHHFSGEQLGGWIIPLLDIWCLVPNPSLRDFNIAAWTPVDHFPVPPDVLTFFDRNPDAVPIAMSRFGEKLLSDAGLAPAYIPLSVDTKAYRPTADVQGVTGQQLIAGDQPLPDDAFIVGMVAMNKGWARDRKGFNEALRAFGQFWRTHQNAVLYMHCDWPGGAEGFNLKELAAHASVPPDAIRWVDQYAYRMGYSAEMMAAIYTALDVLLAPSHGEGFCVPLIEAQACGTPVITTDFSTGPELCGAGWLVSGQFEWDQAQHSSYLCPYTFDVLAKLEEAHDADRAAMAPRAVEFASSYDTDRVWADYWLPFLDTLKPAEPLPLERLPIPAEDGIAVLVPLMRPGNLPRLVKSFDATNDGSARLVVIQDEEQTTYAEKVNRGFASTDEPWLCLVGDDVEFAPGWIEAARNWSLRFDVIGTNDTDGPVKNEAVADGSHADHFLIRRAYVDTYGACLDGPGVLAPEAYRHWYVDKEMIGLAKARNAFVPCLESVIIHHHPGYAGDEEARRSDPTYMRAVEQSEVDAKTWDQRRPLIEMQRTARGRIR